MRLASLELLETKTPKGVQAVLDFGKYGLSIIQNEASYGGDSGLYEIAVFEGDKQVELPGITEEGNTVKGWLTEADVDAIIIKMYFLTGIRPTQV